MKLKKLIAAGLIATMPLTLAACADDEDGDGAVTDEETEQMEETTDSMVDEVEETADTLDEEMDEEETG